MRCGVSGRGLLVRGVLILLVFFDDVKWLGARRLERGGAKHPPGGFSRDNRGVGWETRFLGFASGEIKRTFVARWDSGVLPEVGEILGCFGFGCRDAELGWS